MKTSIYLPAQDEHLKPQAIKDANQKRRTTMNSRDAEYDDEVFKRMLEISKQDLKSTGDHHGRGSRGRKRGSSEGSDEYVFRVPPQSLSNAYRPAVAKTRPRELEPHTPPTRQRTP